jgi:N-methylhydantoinase A
MKRNDERVERWRIEVSADLHYPRQAFDLTVTERDYRESGDLAARLLALFHNAHFAIYQFSDPGSAVEMNRVVLSAVGVLPHANIQRAAAADEGETRFREVRLNGTTQQYRVLHRSDPSLNAQLEGPLIIEQSDTTIVVPSGWSTEMATSGSLLVTKTPAE